jgi:von Willebrand factor type A domain
MKNIITLIISIFLIVFIISCKNDPDNPTSPTPEETATPYSPTPENNSLEQDLDIELNWECTGATSYDIYFGTENQPQFRNNTQSRNENISGLSYSTKYYWYVQANNEDGTQYDSELWNFTTKSNISPPGYQLYKHTIYSELPSYVSIMFQVTDLNGIGVSNLVTTNFEILEDDQPVSPTESAMQIKNKDIIPYTLKTVLLLDNSLSVGDNLSEIKNSALSLVNNIATKQEIAVYKFSDSPILIQDFTNDIDLLQSAINSIELGFNSTDLYGSIIEGVSRWEDTYSTDIVVQGFLIALTDGSDTQGSHTLSQALSSRGDKKIYTIGLGNEIEPNILSQIGNAGFYSITDLNNLSTKFGEIQEEMANFANSFYWLNYMSPKRGDVNHSLKLIVKDNQYSGSNSSITDNFNSTGFYSVYQGLYINPTQSQPYGIDSLIIAKGDTTTIQCLTYLGNNPPQYTWSYGNNSIINVLQHPLDNSKAYIIALGDSGQVSAITVQDVENNLTKTIPVKIENYTSVNEGFENGILPYPWSTYGDNGGWSVTSASAYEGTHSISYGGTFYNIGHLELEARVPQNTIVTISFYTRETDISGDGDLYIDNNSIYDWDNSSSNWSFRSTTYSTGSKGNIKLRWEYSTADYGLSFIDNIEIIW